MRAPPAIEGRAGEASLAMRIGEECSWRPEKQNLGWLMCRDRAGEEPCEGDEVWFGEMSPFWFFFFFFCFSWVVMGKRELAIGTHKKR